MTEINATESEEFDFPSNPISIMNEYVDPILPPLPLFDPLRDCEDEKEFFNEDSEDFPPPPSPNCLSPKLHNSFIATESTDSSNTSCNEVSEKSNRIRETKSPSNYPAECGIKNYVGLLTSSMKVPLFKKNPEKLGETDLHEESKKLNDKKKQFAKLIKKLQLRDEINEAEIFPETVAGESSDKYENHAIIPGTGILTADTRNDGFADVVPPPLFADSFSLKDDLLTNRTEEYISKNSSIGNKEWGSIVVDRPEDMVPEVFDKPLFSIDVRTSSHEDSGMADFKTFHNQPLKSELEATVLELNSALSSGDVKSALRKQPTGSKNKAQEKNSYDEKFFKNSLTQGDSFQCIDQQFEKRESEYNGSNKKKLDSPKTSNLDQNPSVVASTDKPIRSTKESLAERHFRETADSSKAENINTFISTNTMPEFLSSSLINRREALEMSDYKNFAREGKYENIADIQMLKSEPSADKTKQKSENSDRVINAVRKCPDLANQGSKIKVESALLSKYPNVIGFTENQIKSSTHRNSIENSADEKTQVIKLEFSKVQGNSTSFWDTKGNPISIYGQKNEDKVGMINTGGKIQEVINNFQRPSYSKFNKVASVTRSKSAVTLQRKPIQSKSSGLSSKEFETKVFSECMENVDIIKSIAEKSSECEEADEYQDKILPVSQAKAYFESITPASNSDKATSSMLRKALTFSVNKSVNDSHLMNIRRKFQNNVDLNGLNKNLEEKNLPKKVNLLEEITTERYSSTDVGNIDDAPHLPVESLLSQFDGSKKASNMKTSGHVTKCAPPENISILQGKSLSNQDVNFKKNVIKQSQNIQTWKSFLQKFSES